MNGSRSGVDPLPVDPDGLVCSARSCAQPATVDLRWNNPKIHTPDRRKHWLACPAHQEQLAAFLSARGFLSDVEPLDDAQARASAQPSDSRTKAAES